MRLGLRLEGESLDGLTRQARAAEAAGFDLVWLEPAAGLPAPLLAAAALAPRTSTVRIAAAVRAGGHPLAIAADAVVADLASNGRLVLVVSGESAGLLAETADVLLAATAARPFRHAGERWRIPAGLPEHVDVEARVRVTPAPAQLELPIWLTGAAAAEVAPPRGLPHVVDARRAGGGAPSPPARVHPALIDAAPLDPSALVARLRADRDAFGLDVAILRLAPDLTAAQHERALQLVASEVRPRLQLDAIPPGF